VIKREIYRRQVTERWWLRWKNEYLHSLARFKEPNRSERQLAIGDIVFIHKEMEPRFAWRFGIIEKLHNGSDGRIRMATLRTSTGFITRPIQRLYPTELTEDLTTAHRDVTTDQTKSNLAGFTRLKWGRMS
jgi:hypothetical protein